MSWMAWRSKLCRHFVDVTGSWKVRRVRGHFREMRSRSIAISSSSSFSFSFSSPLASSSSLSLLLLSLARVSVVCSFWLLLAVPVLGLGLGLALGFSRWENQVEACGSGGVASEGCLDSWTTR